MRHPIVRAVFAAFAAAAVVFGLLQLGRLARDRLDQQRHYTVAFADLRCDVPPGMDRAAFLGEVQYLGNLPDQINLLEPKLANRLQAAFALHPWVERVEGVSLRGGVPAERVAGPVVRLRLRTPVLAVAGRVVDRFGVLLPAGAPADGLPVFPGEAPPPKGPAGTPWGDPNVEAAARAAGGAD
ncbi:MAG TPA: hypothetical protein VGF55_03350 [Gemmataceae bacterium]|jgi:hypothetical protein